MTDQQIADRLELRDLACRYARVVDDRAYEQVGGIFLADAGLSGPGFDVTGRRSITEALRGIERYSATLHCVHNQLYELRGDEAVGETYCVASHLHERDGRAYKLDMGIRYQDQCRRTAEGWRFARRELRVIWEQDLPLEETNS